MDLELRSGVRRLRREPAFAAAAIALIAGAVGTAAAMAGLIEAVLLQPLPFRDPGRLVWVWSTRTDRDRAFFSLPDFADHREARSIELAAFANWDVTLAGDGEPVRVPGARISGIALPLLGVSPAAGRLLEPADESQRVAVIAESLWRQRFGADPRVLGRTLSLNGEPHQIVGVLPSSLVLPNLEAQVLVPLDHAGDPRRTDRGSNFLRAFGRLREGSTQQMAAQELAAISARLRELYPDNAKKMSPRVLPLADELLGAVRRPLWMLGGGVLLVLIAACANLAGLLLARGAARRDEFAVRTALGATPARLARQVFQETALLVCAGTAVGLLCSNWILAALVSLGPGDLPRAAQAAIDPGAAALAAATAAFATFACGLGPALQAARGDLSRVARRGRRFTVVIEVALTVLLLTAAALLGRGFLALQGIDPGFRASGALAARISLPKSRYTTPQELTRFSGELIRRVEALPGVTAAALGQVVPLSAWNIRSDFTIVGRPPRTPAETPAAQNRWITPGWFAALGIPLMKGRAFDARDDERGTPATIVDEALANRFLAGLDPIGTRLLIDDGAPQPREVEIVGVVGSVKHFALDEEPMATLYTPIAQMTPRALPFFTGRTHLVVRAPIAAAGAIRAEVRALDSDIPVDVRAASDVVSAALAPRRFQATVVGLFAGAALLLAAIGLYGLAAWQVAQRTRELGVRLALGATAGVLVRMIVAEALRLAAAGAALGLVASAAAARALPSLVPGLAVSGISAYVVAPAVLVVVAAAAGWLAARRATSIDPAAALRSV